MCMCERERERDLQRLWYTINVHNIGGLIGINKLIIINSLKIDWFLFYLFIFFCNHGNHD